MGSVSDVVGNSSICSDAEAEAFISIDMSKVAQDSAGDRAFSVGTGGVEQQDGSEAWVLDTGATQHFLAGL